MYPKDIKEKWAIYREAYNNEFVGRIINQPIGKSLNYIENPYKIMGFDWDNHMSYLERIAWNSIRSYGHMPMYPQFPCDNYFFDFANPFFKVVLELDGLTHDKQKDYDRDLKVFEKYGYRTIRANQKNMKPIKNTFFEYSEFKDEQYSKHGEIDETELNVFNENVYNWLNYSIDGIVMSIKIMYFSANKEWANYRYIAENSIRRNILIDIPDSVLLWNPLSTTEELAERDKLILEKRQITNNL